MIATRLRPGWGRTGALMLLFVAGALAPARRAAPLGASAAGETAPASADSIVAPDSAGVADSSAAVEPGVVPTQEESGLPAVEVEAARRPHALIETSAGIIEIELYSRQAPVTVDNFRRYAREGFYEGTVFHRVIPGYLIQGGGFTSDLWPKRAHAPIALEAPNGLSNQRGSVGMARGQEPISATSQFFINLRDNPSLDHPGVDGHGYAVFGKVVAGMDVVDRIAALPSERREVKDSAGVLLGEHRHAPVQAVVIRKVRIVP